MNTITAIFVAALCLNGALATPVSEVQQESRSIYSTSSGMYLGLNATSLTLVMVVVLGTALAILFATQTGLLTDFLGQTSQQRYDQYYQQQEQPYRTKRSSNENMVTKMLQLEQIFKKYEVEEDECKAYIACEAANVERLAENGPIVQKAHELFSAITKPEHLTKLKANKGMMIMKQAFDSAKTRQHEVDVCAPLRNACSALRQKTN
jgi:hypothetical protein